MKKLIFFLASITIYINVNAQSTEYVQQMEVIVSRLDKAAKVSDYQILANDFVRIANAQKNQWLPYYYAALCNVKIGWLYQEDADKIEPFANLSEEQIKKSLSLLDTAKNKVELSEVYCVLSMVNRARVFISPMSNGRKYGPIAHQYIVKAKQKNAENPRPAFLEAWEKYYTPKMWGGDKDKAKELLETAMKQLEAKPTSAIYPHWGKMECEEILKQYN
jgi:hypothetical protein